jgi:phosphate starvation-inducible PhoH-like protein
MGKVIERIVNVERVEDLIAVFGSFDENIRRIEETLCVSIVNRGTELKVSGDEEAADKAVRTLEGLMALAAKGEVIDEWYHVTLVKSFNDEKEPGEVVNVIYEVE